MGRGQVNSYLCYNAQVLNKLSSVPVRTETYFAGAALVRDLESAGTIAHVHHDGGDIIHVELKTGEHAWIHLIESSIPSAEIVQTLEANADKALYTLFLFWADRLLPSPNHSYEPDEWMRPLLAVHSDKLYGYEVRGRDIYIFPVYFEGSGKVRRIRYGAPIDVTRFTCRSRSFLTANLNGRYLWVDFGERTSEKAAPQPEANPLEVFYAALGLTSGADRRAIKRAYRLLAQQYHPDVNTDPAATARMQQINDAYKRIMRALTANHSKT